MLDLDGGRTFKLRFRHHRYLRFRSNGPPAGERGSALWNEWFGHEQLVINYVNTFRRIGERIA